MEWIYYSLLITVVLLTIVRVRLESKKEIRNGLIISIVIISTIVGVTSLLSISSKVSDPVDVKLVNYVANSIRHYELEEDKYTLIYDQFEEIDINKGTFEYFRKLWNTEKIIDSTSYPKFEYYRWNRDSDDALIYTKITSYYNYLINVYEPEKKITDFQARVLGLYRRPIHPVINSSYIIEPRMDLIFGLKTSDTLNRMLSYLSTISVNFRPMILVWDSTIHGKDIIELQKDYWLGGKENEVVFCIGIDESNIINWSGSFSWNKTSEFEEYVLSNSLYKGKFLNLEEITESLIVAYRNGYWNPMKSEDYSIAKVPLSEFHMIFTLIIMSIVLIFTLLGINKKITIISRAKLIKQIHKNEDKL